MAGRWSASPTGRCGSSFRLAPLISAIGMSIVLQNYVAGRAGRARQAGAADHHRRLSRCMRESATASSSSSPTSRSSSSSPPSCCWRCSPGWCRSTRLGRDMRACEQDQTMAALLGVDVDRTISLTFVIGAALAAVAGMMYLLYYGVVDFFMGFVAGIKAFTAAVLGGIGSLPGAMLGGLADRPDRDVVVGLFLGRVQGRRRVLDPDRGPDLPSDRPARPARSRESLTGGSVSAPPAAQTSRAPGARLHLQESADQRAGGAGAVLADDRRAHRGGIGRTTDLLDALRRPRRHRRGRVRRQHPRRVAAAMVGTGRDRQGRSPRRCRAALCDRRTPGRAGAAGVRVSGAGPLLRSSATFSTSASSC